MEFPEQLSSRENKTSSTNLLDKAGNDCKGGSFRGEGVVGEFPFKSRSRRRLPEIEVGLRTGRDGFSFPDRNTRHVQGRETWRNDLASAGCDGEIQPVPTLETSLMSESEKKTKGCT
ncbi:hypothetical protein ANTPLA_LOCUS1292 [Anthophora plagiata]